MNIRTLKYTVYLFLFCAGYLYAGNDYTFERINIEQGLSRSTVYAITQDTRGFMWFATANGINMFDGYGFTVYSSIPGDTTSVSDKGITCLIEDDNGVFWLGASDGMLNRFDRKTGKFTHVDITGPLDTEYEEGLGYVVGPLLLSRNNNSTITSLAEDDYGNIWIATWGNGLKRYNKYTKEVDHFYKSKATGLATNRILRLFVDDKSRVWVGTFGEGLALITRESDNPRFIHYKLDRIGNAKITSFYQAKDNSYYIGTYSGELLSVDFSMNNVPMFYRVVEDFSLDSPIMSISEDQSGRLWIGTFGQGLYCVNKKSGVYQNFRNNPDDKNSLSDDEVLSVFVSSEGIIWAGTHLGRGISKIFKEDDKFNHVVKTNDRKGLNDDIVWAVEKDSSGKFLFGTYKGGLNVWDRDKNEFSYIKKKSWGPSIADDHIRSVKTDKSGNIWLGYYSSGLGMIEKSTGKIFHYVHDPEDSLSLGGNQVIDIFMENDTTFWLGTFGGGLNKFTYNGTDKNLKFTRYLHEEGNDKSPGNNRVYVIFKDSEGVMWFGAFGGGLNRFDPETGECVVYKHDAGKKHTLSDNRVMAIEEDDQGYLWVGTYGGGINRFDKKTGKFVNYNETNGFYTNVVYGIIKDFNGDLWISSDNGLIKMNSETGNFLNYDIQDGVQSMEFSGGAYYITPEGEVFFGGINGLNHFFPKDISRETSAPPVYITGFKIFNKPVQGEIQNIRLKHNQNFFSFEFAAIDYFSPEKRKYAYKLQGLDTEWNFSDSKSRTVNYTNLAPGEYIFRVKVSNKDGRWGNREATVFFEILPPFWQTWWFIAAAVMMISAALWMAYRIKLRQALAIEKLKTRLAADLHDNIGAGLTEISILSELANAVVESNSATAVKYLQNISESARSLVDSMSDIVWVVNPNRDSLHDLIIRLKDSYSDILQQMGISFKIHSIEKLEQVKLPLEYKQHLYLIFKESLNNSIKHSKCKKILLEANVWSDYIHISLSDDGIGIDKDHIIYGEGLKNIESRARQIHGKITWESRTGKGTTIKFSGKIGAAGSFANLLKRTPGKAL